MLPRDEKISRQQGRRFNSLLKKGTGSERPLDFVVNFVLLRGACPLFQHPC
jgi:hypothetical protein